MSDVQLLFVVVVALYVWECACWLRRGGIAFSSWWGRHWRILQPGALIANQAGGFVLAWPLPPLGSLFVANQFPLSLSPEGVLGFVATNVNSGWRPAQSGRFVRFEEIRQVRVRGRKLMVNGEFLVTCASPGLARQYGEELQQLAKLKASQRNAAIVARLRASFDAPAVERRAQEFRKHAAPVRGLSNGLLAYVFLAVPAVIWNIGFKLSWPGLLAGLVGLTSATAFFFARAHRALYPKAGDERFTQTLTILLAPTTAMRAHDALSRSLLEAFHPLAVAKVLLSDGEFRPLARRILLDLRHPALPGFTRDLAVARATETQARANLRTAAEEFLKESGVVPEELCRPPTPTDGSCHSYCPRCQAQFTLREGSCEDCGGLELMAFVPARGKARVA